MFKNASSHTLRRFRNLALTIMASAVIASSPEETKAAGEGPQPVYINGSWVVRKADTYPNKRVYRRYSFTKDMEMPNVMLLQCPKDPGKHVHFSLEMRRVGPIDKVFSSEFESFNARFLVDGRHSFTLPGEFIKTELFFDRTPDTAEDFDEVIRASEFQTRFGQREVRVVFKVMPEFTKALPELLQAMKAGPVSILTTAEAIRDCRQYRGER
ncbi:hypothetical protein [Microvirga tunisiensis]|nr:hypothetical protein [Microvirga tunisiensis]MPR09218.1 hypothetical protein [Microvirga tunisiensis]